MADKTRIDWADATWNPITGCLHGCEYCYAQRVAKRFGDPTTGRLHELETQAYDSEGCKHVYPFGFAPTFHRYRLEIPTRWQRPRNIFVCSMADLFGEWVPDEWIREVFVACKKAPQHRYMFLTKAPERLKKLLDNGVIFPENCWFGTSITRSADAETGTKDRIDYLMDTWPVKGVKWFASIEPILENLSDGAIENMAALDWVIIGAETGNRKDRVIPEKEWIDRIVKRCRYYQVPVFMKESLRELMGMDFRQEVPWPTTLLDLLDGQR